MACGVPLGEPVQVAAVRADQGARPASESRRVELAEGEIPEVVLPLTAGEGFEAPVELEGLTVEVSARVREDLMDIGIRRETLGRRFVSTDDIQENIDGATDAAHLILRQHIPGVRVRMDGDYDCVYSLTRGGTLDPSSGLRRQFCAQLVVDGIPADASVLQLIKPEMIAAMAFLNPNEAGARFPGMNPAAPQGTFGGVLYIWTRGGVEGNRDPR
jgi:hypothetical protein